MTDKICILGFADSRNEAPYADQGWEIWGVNDVYQYVPRVDRIFEVHELSGLGNRRNPEHAQKLAQAQVPVYLAHEHPDMPNARAYPWDEVFREFGRYFTNSIGLMTALAILELTEQTELPDGRTMRLAKPGAQLAFFGVDMSALSEYASQRPNVEYMIGQAAAMGIAVLIPQSSDLCKSGAIYGLGTTEPLRARIGAKTVTLQQQKAETMGEIQRRQAEIQQLQSKLDQQRGWKEALAWIERCYTMPTDRHQTITREELAEQRGLSTGSPNGQILEDVKVGESNG